ncbi:MAG: glycosyltransferase [Ignavibacteria bacterium]|nr:glycosyltransferase [Ignavibacteria bacterium]
MKIAYVSTFYPYRGGIAQFNANLYRALSKLCNVRAFNFSRQYPNFLFPGETQYVQSSEKVEVVPSLRILDSINPISYQKTVEEIHRYEPDIVLTKYWMPFFAPSLGFVLLRTKKKCYNISIIDNIEPHEKIPFSKILNKFFLSQNHYFIVMSEQVQNELIKINKDARFIRLLHPLYDHFGKKIPSELAREMLNIEKNKKVLLFFGFIREYKGLDILIEAMSQLDDSYHLIVAGELYENKDKYIHLINELQIEKRISLFLRYIPDAEVPTFFSASDVCILPYKTATQSGIVGVAYNFDLPIIATNVGGLPEMIEPFRTGLIVQETSANGLAKSIEQFFQESKEKFLKGIETYKSKANWDYFAKNILSIYEKLKNSE